MIVSGNMTRNLPLRIVGFVVGELSIESMFLVPLHRGQFEHPRNCPYRPLFSRIPAPHFGHFNVVTSLDVSSTRFIRLSTILISSFVSTSLSS
jgi:hypothetical protein